MAARLRSVPADEVPPKPAARRPRTPRAKSIVDAARGGKQRELLVAMRDRIARTVEDPTCPPRDLASLSRRLMEIAKDIEALDLAAKQEGKSGRAVKDEPFDASAI